MNVALKDRSPSGDNETRHTRESNRSARPPPRYRDTSRHPHSAASGPRVSSGEEGAFHRPRSEVYSLSLSLLWRQTYSSGTGSRRNGKVEARVHPRKERRTITRFSPPRPRRSIASVGSASRARLIVGNHPGVLRGEGRARHRRPSIRPSLRTYSQWKKVRDTFVP